MLHYDYTLPLFSVSIIVISYYCIVCFHHSTSKLDIKIYSVNVNLILNIWKRTNIWHLSNLNVSSFQRKKIQVIN